MSKDTKQRPHESQWTLDTGLDVNVRSSDMDDRDVAITFLGSESSFSVDMSIEDAMQIRDELNRVVDDLFRSDDTIRCPACGYHWLTAMAHGDHQNCRRFPFFPDEAGESHAINR